MSRNYLLIVSLVYLALIAHTIIAPPAPHNIEGIIYDIGGSYVLGGVPVTVNNTNTSDFIQTRTNGVGPPAVDATYATTINGSDNDTIIVTSWSSNWYGTNTTTLENTTTYVNVRLNITRPSETNVTITIPSNNSIYNLSDYFNVTVNVKVIGGQNGGVCSATINISNGDVLKLAPGEQSAKSLGSIDLGSSVISGWNVSVNSTGNTNITVRANCTNDGRNFDSLDVYTVYNVTAQDGVSPVVQLQSPANDSRFKFSNDPVTLEYSVTDGTKIANCSLIINNEINQTNRTITRGVTQSFSVIMSNNTYNWSVNCTDNSSNYNVGYSGFFNLSITPNFAPTVTNLVVDTPIDLTAGSTTRVYCNATLNDDNNISDIMIINSTFFHSTVQSSGEDDNNNHYTNLTCWNVSKSTYEINISCSFAVQYYANNGSWKCNITAVDESNVVGADNISSTVNDLLAIGLSPTIIDYGNLEPGKNSTLDIEVNVTNLGNVDFNITVDGFAVIDGDGLAMDCEKGNIPLMYEKYSIEKGDIYGEMTNITDIATLVKNFTLPQRTNDTTYKNDRNYTYWKIGIPYGIKGLCAGNVTFTTVPV
ncbi:MAG: hypothetical protein U9O94_07545 [Nanoarchaeota archaeon]|nr:hypothetical protein [Nanoarchaeota archaeon]